MTVSEHDDLFKEVVEFHTNGRVFRYRCANGIKTEFLLLCTLFIFEISVLFL